MPLSFSSRAVSAAALLMMMLGACSQPSTQSTDYAAGSSSLSSGPVSSPNDDKDYRYLRLENGMQVLLVSDPDTEKAAASLDVYVGSASNPADRGGLAHFLEHMLFLGTEKYPDSGEYARFVSEHGGSRNAYTAFEHTNYYFDIDEGHLAEALDRFGQFFISPKFDAQYVEREVNAVQAEYQLGLKTDGRRNLDVLREIVNPDHPYSILGVGTTETLADRPGQPVREDLLAFYRQYYSANLMALTVLGSEPLDELETLARSIFDAVPNHQAVVASVQAPLYLPDSLPMMVYIQPEASQRQLLLSFPMPDYSREYHAKPLHYISNLIGHEGEGSLLSLLKTQGWADGLGAGMGITYRGGAAFSVSVSLTEKGMQEREQVLEKLFEYIQMLNTQGPQQALYDEQAQLAELSFRFRPDVQPMSYVTGLSSAMHLFEPQDILRGNYIMADFQPEQIDTIQQRYLNPENVVVTVVGKDVPVDRHSEFYQTPYSVQQLAQGEGDWRGAQRAKPDARLHLPAPNTFIAENVELVPLAQNNPAVPSLVKDSENLRIWFRQDGEFRVPRGAMYANFRSARVSDTADNAAAAQLYVSLLQDAVNEYTYPAYLAGLNFSLFSHSRGISLKVSGYNDKQLTLLGRMVESVASAELDTHRFDNIRAAMIRQLENTKTARAFRQVVGDARQLVLSGQFDEKELIAALQGMSPESVEAYAQTFWSSTDVDVMLNGNYQASVVRGVESALQPLLAKSRTPQPPQLQVVKLAAGEKLVYSAEVEHNDAVLFWYLQGPDDSMTSRAMSALSGQVVSADYFEELRTEQQLGYVVSAFSWPQLQVPALVFMVQSPLADAAHLQAASRQFLEQMAAEGAVDPDQFERHRSALLKEILQPHKNISERSEYFWQEIARRELDFDSRERMAAAVSSIDFADWQAWFREHVLERPASLAVVAPGAKGVLPAGDAVKSRDSFKSEHESYQRR